MHCASSAFRTLSPRYLLDRRPPLPPRLLAYKAVVLPTLLYGAAESWALGAKQLQQLESFHASCLRQMLGASVLEHVSREQLYEQSGEVPISALLGQHRMRWLGHVAWQADSTPLNSLSLRSMWSAGRGSVCVQRVGWARSSRHGTHAPRVTY